MDALSRRAKELRETKLLSLREAAERTGVSKSMLSKIERGLASPTATVLGKIAEGYGVSISELVGGPVRRDDVVVLRVDEQPVFSVPKTGFVRRSLSPFGPNRNVDLVVNILPPGQSSGPFPPHRPGIEETLVVASGQLRLYLKDKAYDLNAGDSVFYRAQVEHRFDNPSKAQNAVFFIMIDNSGAHLRQP